VQKGNLFGKLPGPTPDEVIETLWALPGLTVERIVSHGQATPAGSWYDQDADEWVVLLTGAARLRIEGRDELLEMRPGDYVLLPAHLRHRVEWTDPDRDSVWLAVHARRAGPVIAGAPAV
jgi:cupin 2 domain-containing protein